MILRIYTIFDSKIPAFNNPFYMRSVDEAIRGFTEVCNDPSTNFYKFSEDYTLFELGSFDMSTGLLNVLPTPISVCKAFQLKRSAYESSNSSSTLDSRPVS